MLYDVVIIGSGLAGLTSALHASKKGNVLLVTKSQLTESNSRYAQGGIAAVFQPHDNFAKHVEDTMIAGAFHNNKSVVKYFIEQSPKLIKMLQKLGVSFEKTSQGKFLQNQEAGHRFRRIVHVGDHTGLSIVETLVKLVRKKPNITIWENCFAKDFIVKNKICYGVKIIRKNLCVPVFARRIVLATGGVGQLYRYTTNPTITTGDGIALAARAGCNIKDMEFVQFHPTAFAKARSPLFLISETVRGEGALLLNAKGERYMLKYHKDAELAPRDIVSIATYQEQKKGKIFLDIRHRKTSELRKKFPTIYAYLKDQGFDMGKDLIPVTPAAHYLCGGIIAGLDGKTNIRNLYALGEVACTGLQGANRLASNSLLEAAIMGEHVMDSPLPVIKNFPKISATKRHYPKASKKITKLKKTLQTLMWNNVGIIRTKNLLKQALKRIQSIKKQLPKEESIAKLELQNMLNVAELIVRASLKRRKSLGAHYRKN